MFGGTDFNPELDDEDAKDSKNNIRAFISTVDVDNHNSKICVDNSNMNNKIKKRNFFLTLNS